eukprot:15474588-Alexandrium_andersonii.AAC.1
MVPCPPALPPRFCIDTRVVQAAGTAVFVCGFLLVTAWRARPRCWPRWVSPRGFGDCGHWIVR